MGVLREQEEALWFQAFHISTCLARASVNQGPPRLDPGRIVGNNPRVPQKRGTEIGISKRLMTQACASTRMLALCHALNGRCMVGERYALTGVRQAR